MKWLGERNDVDSGALDFFGYEGKHVHYRINLFILSFCKSISDISVMEKSNKANHHHLGLLRQ